ncbi:aminoacyl-tRNA hydrolase [Flavobacterium sp. NRK F10]|uniref:Aminoacyl-tRNA hydrolase n=1 Tax=Flavobacterium sediminis TaxID=2201181 RepID=A0A2U8QUQ7_9FLAO|nr:MULTISPECIES: alternative ribosome rescue aminoacyl-tRNA hydrolase ArfB [Flavobacterium]AWM13927.1 aminoacyl-tRNA hydrolase [Flavobacterium sediminis]MCO6175086.1 aminoacyl-tRNA hydrolase [Flavobacterium sp. NRK F10]
MNKEYIQKELRFKAVRSSGAGGQNVNKVATKVVLNFDVPNSSGLTAEEKALLHEKLTTKISQEGILILSCDEDRSQLKNKGIVTQRFWELLSKSMKRPKVRKATKTPRSAQEKRLQSKKKSSEIKANRKKPNF